MIFYESEYYGISGLGSPYLMHYGVKGMKWGVRRYQNSDGSLTPAGRERYKYSRPSRFRSMKDTVLDQASNDPKPIKQKPIDLNIVKQRGNLTKKEAEECASIANKMLTDISKAEPKITRDIVSAVASTGGKMYGLDNRIKQTNSLAAKIGSDAKEDGISFERAASGIKDSIRYTALSTDKQFVNSYNSIKKSLESKGYAETRCKNYFEDYKQGKVMHKSVQSIFENRDGIKFEVQFQTPSSQAAKELKTPMYEESRSVSVTPARKSELERQMRNLAEMVPNPSKIETIKSH